MNYSNEFITDLINKHLNGSLSQEEKFLFDKKLMKEEFQRQVMELKSIQKGIKIYELRRMQRLLQAEEESINHNQAQSDSGRPPDAYGN